MWAIQAYDVSPEVFDFASCLVDWAFRPWRSQSWELSFQVEQSTQGRLQFLTSALPLVPAWFPRQYEFALRGFVFNGFLLDRAELNNVVLHMLFVHQTFPMLQQRSEPKARTSLKIRCQSSCDNVPFAHRSNHGILPGSGSCLPFRLAKQDSMKL